jgi:hypothetical protein
MSRKCCHMTFSTHFPCCPLVPPLLLITSWYQRRCCQLFRVTKLLILVIICLITSHCVYSLTWSPCHVDNYAPTTPQPKSVKLRWDKADSNEYHRITEVLLSKLQLPRQAIQQLVLTTLKLVSTTL